MNRPRTAVPSSLWINHSHLIRVRAEPVRATAFAGSAVLIKPQENEMRLNGARTAVPSSLGINHSHLIRVRAEPACATAFAGSAVLIKPQENEMRLNGPRTAVPSSLGINHSPLIRCGLGQTALPSRSMPTRLMISAVFATMNRSQTAMACVRALAMQSRLPDLVIVADNCPTDDTVSLLKSLDPLPFRLVVHPMPENGGNAGGVQVAMDMAFAAGADAVWILDDDSWPRETALQAMLEGEWDPRIVRHALQVDPFTKKFTWPLQVDDGNGGWRLAWSEKELADKTRVRSRISWTGALLPREVRASVGPVNGDLFIRGEDEEYPWRIEKAGFSQEAIRDAVLDHPGPTNVVHWHFLGKNFFFERGLVDWKLYYKVRNMVWLKRKQVGCMQAIKIAAVYLFAATLIDGPGRIPLLCRAIRAGWDGRLGKM